MHNSFYDLFAKYLNSKMYCFKEKLAEGLHFTAVAISLRHPFKSVENCLLFNLREPLIFNNLIIKQCLKDSLNKYTCGLLLQTRNPRLMLNLWP